MTKKEIQDQLEKQENLAICENQLKMVQETIDKLNTKKQQLLLQIHQLKKK
jgi:hypothetical protein